MKSYVFVSVQAILIITLILLPSNGGDSKTWMLLSRLLILLGMLVLIISISSLRHSLSVLPKPVNKGRLQTGDIYKYVRHPMYTGVLIVATGLVIGKLSLIGIVGLLALVILFELKSRYEESLLNKKYPDYESYMKKTPKYLPFVNLG